MVKPDAQPTLDSAELEAQLRDDQIAGLHIHRTEEELREHIAALVAELLPGASAAVVLWEGESGGGVVEVSIGPDCPLQHGQPTEDETWNPPGRRSFPLRYRDHELGALLVCGGEERGTGALERVLSHYSVALVNLKLNADTIATSEAYFHSLQAFEEGVVLFQEQDKEAVSARFLSLVTTLLGSPAGAVYLLDEPGDLESELRCDQVLGIPESMLDTLCLPGGSWWPRRALEQPAHMVERGDDGVLQVLDNELVPDALSSIATCPLSYHGLVVGLALAFNAGNDAELSARLESVRRLGELGAALFHRIKLEEVAVRSREVETQLAIAARIQERLMPDAAPASKTLECAWTSQPAQTIGGDYVDILTDDDGTAFVIIADVSGHGIDSALLMTSFRATCRADCFRRSPADLMAKINAEIAHETGDTGMFVTSAAFRIAPDGRSARYASAGHNPIFLYRAADQHIDKLESTGPGTGFFPSANYDEIELEMAEGDVLLLYTDGLVEAKSPNDEFELFGDERAEALLTAHAAGSADEIQEALLTAMDEFSGDGERDDDVSLLVIKAV